MLEWMLNEKLKPNTVKHVRKKHFIILFFGMC